MSMFFILKQTQEASQASFAIELELDDPTEIDCVLDDELAQIFLFSSAGHSYHASDCHLRCFFNLLACIRKRGWVLLTSNAYMDGATHAIIKTFYFELQQKKSDISTIISRSPKVAVSRRASINFGSASGIADLNVTSPSPSADGSRTPFVFAKRKPNLKLDALLDAEAPASNSNIMAAQEQSVATTEIRSSHTTTASNGATSSMCHGNADVSAQAVTLLPDPLPNPPPHIATQPIASSSQHHSVPLPSTPAAAIHLQASQQSFSTPSLVAAAGPTTATPRTQVKNDEYFSKIREEQEQERILKAQKESKMTAEELRLLRESESVATQHDADKTAHYAKLGATFVNRGATPLLSSGRGGRGIGGRVPVNR